MKAMLNRLRYLKHGTQRVLVKHLARLGENSILRKTRATVASGNFSGTKLINKQVFGSKAAKYLGTYEMELQGYFATAIKRGPKIVCNIGAAEGYYALGFARAVGVEKVIVFEALESGQELIRSNARLNGLEESIQIYGVCDADALGQLLLSSKIDLMLIDIEGAELDILTPHNVSLLEKTELLIESHDFCRPNCLQILKSKFEPTHDLQTFTSAPRTSSNFPLKSWLPSAIKEKLMDEMRPDKMNWLACIPKHNMKNSKGAS